ncbi:gamma-glutamyltransferase [Xanthobacter tagetidis]|nr:gamma-glutamyltransferase [Xanthobacter tagetidis]MBB6305830.1 gamma-glutamyltranspeptidase/glutathione hydrolase [Xanthobacter tagetidis]
MTRPTTLAMNGMVTSPHYLASQSGLKVLREGGNAVEAAIATAATIAVAYPQANSIGGDNFWLVGNAGESAPRALNASGRSGSLATLEHYQAQGLSAIPARGPLAANTIPGAVSGWQAAYDYSAAALGGRIPFKELLADAISYARGGIPVSSHQEVRGPIDFTLEDPAFGNIQRFPATRAAYCHPDGRPLKRGEVMRQPDLADTLALIAEDGARAFYQGETAAKISDALLAEGGVLTREDFADHAADWVAPISVAYRGRTAFNLPPNTQGMAALGILNILENFEVARIEDGSTAFYHLMAEAVKAAFADRDAYLTDPDFFDIPLDRLLSAEHGRAQAERIRAEGKAAFSAPAMRGGDTVWIGTVDKEGHCVSLIQSICDGFGSGLVIPGTGVLMQNRGKYFALDTTSPNRVAPRKRCFHTLIAGLLYRDGAPELVYGTMGGEGQPQTQAALVVRIIDYGLSPQEAIEAPRWLQGRMLDLSQPGSQLNLEGRVADKVVRELRQLGHRVALTTDYSDLMGHAGAILIDRKTGVLHGGADPRGDGAAVGF